MSSVDEVARSPGDGPWTGELLLELLSEEIPARMQRRAIGDLSALLCDKLTAAEIPAAEIRGYVTPRRLVIMATGIPATQPDHTEERRGPRKGASKEALDGFLRSAGLAAIEECQLRDTGRGEFYFAIIRRSGRPSADVLPALIAGAIVELPWPKSMQWPGTTLRWVRPLTSIMCLWDGAVLPLPIDGIALGRTTRGHRFLSPGVFYADSAAEYLEKLQHAYVILDQDRRRELIRADLDRRAAELGVTVKPDPGLLDEVTGLAEFPLVLAGAIDPDFMALPPEVLQTAMRAHQKYFSCAYPDGQPAPHFLFVADNLPEDGGGATIAGNERVLRARLADARFFWDQDRKLRLEDRVEGLKDRVYHAKLGSVYDKIRRIESLAAFLADQLYAGITPTPPSPASRGGLGRGQAVDQSLCAPPIRDNRPDLPGLDSRFRGDDGDGVRYSAARAAHLAKADLSTGMVGEFPELQGVMGRYYALYDGEDQRVANAIAEHYQPLGPNDACPDAPISVAVALADKIDALTAFFAIGEKPTGSRDPFALRRAAQGVIRLILENRLRLPLAEVFRNSYEILTASGVAARFQGRQLRGNQIGSSLTDPTSELLEFIADRLKIHLRGQGVGYAIGPDTVSWIPLHFIRHDLIAAVFALTEDDLVRLLTRAGELAGFIASEDGANLLIAYRRAANIVAIEERRDGSAYGDTVDADLLVQPEEKALAVSLDSDGARARELLKAERFGEAMAELARLRQPVDAFFDKVTVNTSDAKLRENRLRLLARIRDTMNRVADFSQIEG